MLSGGNLHAPQDSHESKDQSPFSKITFINFWRNPSIKNFMELQVESLIVGIDLMLSGGNLHAPQDSHESKDKSPFSNITSNYF